MSTQGRGPGRARAAVMVMLVATWLAGCTSDSAAPGTSPQSASQSSPVSASPTPTPTPTTPGVFAALPNGVKPDRPLAFDEPATLERALEIARYFFQLFPYSEQTGDIDEFAALSHPDCTFCSSTLDEVAARTSRSEHTVDGGITIETISGTEVDPGRWFAVQLTILEAPSSIENDFGTVVGTSPGEQRFALEVAVVNESGKWQIRAVSHEEIPA